MALLDEIASPSPAKVQLRRPDACLADVCWLPRFIDKARAMLDGTLPSEYLERFGDRRGVDGAFLRFFRLKKDAFVEAVRASNGRDLDVANWFNAQPRVTADKVAEWNRIAPEFGKPGQPGFEAFRSIMQNVYQDTRYTGVESIFEVIDADEAPSGGEP